eukprot:Opistho-1_new@68212
MSKWIRKNDTVVVIAGNDKGRMGEVLLRLENRVVIRGVNIRKKHVKPQSKDEGSRQIISKEMPIHISNVSVCNAEGKPVRLKVRVKEDGSKELYYKEGDKEVFHRLLKNPPQRRGEGKGHKEREESLS